MRFNTKLALFIVIFLAFSSSCNANQTRIIIAPVNVHTVNSTIGLYPDSSDYIANDIINNLNKNLLYDVPDLKSAENLLMSQGLWEKYRDFLKSYKDRGIIDYQLCSLLHEKLGVHKILLITSGFSMQSMVLKRSFLYRIGIIEADPIESHYRMDVNFTMVDTQSGLVDFERGYKRTFETETFETPSNSLSDNVVSTEKIKTFSEQLAEDISMDVFIKTGESAYTNVKSSIVPATGFDSREGKMAKDGHSSLTNNEYLKNKRKKSFKNWVKERIDF